MNTEELWKTIDKCYGQFLSSNGFVRFGRGDWIRRVNSVLHRVLLERTKGGRLRMRAFVVSLSNPGRNFGGNVTRSCVGGITTFGGDYLWSCDSREELQLTVSEFERLSGELLFPWFRAVLSDQGFDRFIAQHSGSAEYRLSTEIDQDRLDTLDDFAPQLRSELRPLSDQQIFSLIRENLDKEFVIHGFSLLASESLTYGRRRDEVHDIIRFEPINFGLHFGSYAFNWVKELSLSGRDKYDDDSAVMMNGGAVSEGGLGQGGQAFLVCDPEERASTFSRFKSNLRRNVLPALELVSGKETFLQSVKPEMKGLIHNFFK